MQATRRLLKRIFADIRRGENVDLFTTIIIILVILALSVFGITDDIAIAVAILTVLGLISVSLLVTRYQLADMNRAAGGADLVKFFKDKDSNLIGDMGRSDEIWMLGLQLAGTMRDNFYLLRERVSMGAQVKVLICDPQKLDMNTVAKRFARGSTAQSFMTGFEQVIEQFRNISQAEQVAGSVQVRLLDVVPSTSMYLFPKTEMGIIHVEMYGYKSKFGSIPKFRITKYQQPDWYEHFYSQFELMWNDAKPLTL